MAHRKFVDKDGHEWEIRPRNRREWDFEPSGDNPGRTRTATSPGYEKDPFELSKEELQRIFDLAPPPPTRSARSPFTD